MSYMVENIVRKGEIACSNLLCVKMWHCLVMSLTFPKQTQFFKYLQYNSFENSMGTGEIAANGRFHCFPQFLVLFTRTFHSFLQT